MDCKLHGNINLMALKGATIEVDSLGRECIIIPIDVAEIKRNKARFDIGIVIFPYVKRWFDHMIVQASTKLQRDNDEKSLILGNATTIKNDPNNPKGNNFKYKTPPPKEDVGY